MSALSYSQIKEYLTKAEPAERLVVSPLLDPATQLDSKQAAVDVRLGRFFSIVRPWVQGVAELIDARSLEPSLENVVLGFGQPFIIHPHQFVLARTLETFRLPTSLLAYVIGRSSWGRRGLIVATAVVVHPGFSGPITLELRNLGETPIALYPMDRIAQLTFHEVGSPSAQHQTSQFASLFYPTLGQVRDPKTLEGLRSMVAKRSALSSWMDKDSKQAEFGKVASRTSPESAARVSVAPPETKSAPAAGPRGRRRPSAKSRTRTMRSP
jgi:dCTP deaminase